MNFMNYAVGMEMKSSRPTLLEHAINLRMSAKPTPTNDLYGSHALFAVALNRLRIEVENAESASKRVTDELAAARSIGPSRVKSGSDEPWGGARLFVLEHASQSHRSTAHAVADQLLARVLELTEGRPQRPPACGSAFDDLILRAAVALNQQSVVPQTVTSAGADPLAAARDRGRHYTLAELQRAENLSLRDAATYSGRSDRAINEARLKGQLYALVPPGKQRGLRYPQWQFDAGADRLSAVLAPFVEAGASCWVVHNFMQRPHEALGDTRPMDWILDASRPIEPVVSAAKSRYADEQGAA